ncbi:MAG: FAD-dependent oxidoreductase [Patescibacteria group bacterium]|jgi:thioredoxin reductase (NADPH)|nr:FAD-dependent oxidoreductase [Patescibacteria group bacterium]
MKDLIIIGAGPAGLSASVYASRYGIKNTIIGQIPGGLTTETHEIGNWLGDIAISGADFAQKAAEHAMSFGTEIKNIQVKEIKKEDKNFIIKTSEGEEKARVIIVATGTKHRHLNIPGEKEFLGRGVSFCATCDGFFYRGKTVAVVGGNNSAAAAAVHLGNIAEKVYIVYRKENVRAERYWLDAIEKNPKIEIINNTNVLEIKGEFKVETLVFDNEYMGSNEFSVDGLFVEIGLDPNTEVVKNIGVELDERGYINVGLDGRTSIDGLWAAGDITNGSNNFAQIVTAASEGAIAAEDISTYLQK